MKIFDIYILVLGCIGVIRSGTRLRNTLLHMQLNNKRREPKQHLQSDGSIRRSLLGDISPPKRTKHEFNELPIERSHSD